MNGLRDFAKAFHAVPQKILLEKLLMYGLDGWTVKCFKPWLNGLVQRLAARSAKFSQ